MLSFDVADAAIRLRLLVADEGSFECRVKEPFIKTTKFVLPGEGTIVVIATDGASTSTAKMFHADGRSMSVDLDLEQPDMLASLIHNVDVESFSDGLPARVGVEDLAAIDAAVMSAEEGVASKVEEMLELRDFQGRIGNRDDGRPGDDHLLLLGRMAVSRDPRVAGAAMSAFEARSMPRRPFDDRASLIRCSSVVESLYANNGDAVASTVATEQGTWHRVFTRAGITAVARRMDRIEGEFYKWPEVPAKGRALIERIQALLDRGMHAPQEEGLLHYVLERNGVAGVVALVRGTDFHAERGDRRELTDADLDALADLKRAVAPGMGHFGLPMP